MGFNQFIKSSYWLQRARHLQPKHRISNYSIYRLHGSLYSRVTSFYARLSYCQNKWKSRPCIHTCPFTIIYESIEMCSSVKIYFLSHPRVLRKKQKLSRVVHNSYMHIYINCYAHLTDSLGGRFNENRTANQHNQVNQSW